MLADILYIMRQRLIDTNIFGDVHALADRVRKFEDGKPLTFPAVYVKNGQYNPLRYDATGGMAYFRRNGKSNVARVTTSDLQIVSCTKNQVFYEINIPIKLIAFIPKSKAECEDGFEDDFFANIILDKLSDNNIIGTNAHSISFLSTGYDTDNINVLQGEYSNSDVINDINYEYSYLSVDFNLEIIIDKTCLNICNDYAYAN